VLWLWAYLRGSTWFTRLSSFHIWSLFFHYHFIIILALWDFFTAVAPQSL